MSLFNCRTVSVLTLSLFLVACASKQTLPMAAGQTEYCDRYFAYEMCVRDHNRDGKVDFMYFADTQEVFMAMPGFDDTNTTGRPAHRCIQPMDAAMQNTASDLLTINGDTGAMDKAKIKSRLLLSYSRYVAKVNRCHGTELAAEESAFGEGDLDF